MRRRVKWSDSTRKMRPFVLVLMVALVVLAILPAMALAATRTWNGSGGTPFWTLGMNWVGGVAPVNGDDLVFPLGAFIQATSDDPLLTEVGSVDVSGSIVVDGLPLAMTGPLSAHQSPAWNVDTYLAGDLVVSETPAATPAPMTIGGTLDMNNELYDPDGYSLTFDVASLGSIRDSGSILGPVAACSLTKTGPGDLRLGWGAADATPWTGSNTWGGPTDVQAGSLTLWNPGALAQGNNLTIAPGATVSAHYAVAGHTADIWDNSIKGSGNLNVDAGALTLRGDSQEFTGTTTVGPGSQLTVGDTGWAVIYGATNLEGGTLRGVGGVDTLTIDDGGVVSPGANDYDVGLLFTDSEAALTEGGSYDVDISDVDAGPIYGYDFLQTGDTGTVDITATPAHPFTIKLRSSSGGASGDAANFDNGFEYHWSIIWAGGGFTGFDPHAFTIDTSEFTNDFGDGEFTVEEGWDHTIDVVYSPVQAPVITSCSLPDTVGAAGWTNVSPVTWSVQAVDPQMDPMTLNYQIDGAGDVFTAPLSGTPKHATGQSALEGMHEVDIWVTDVHGYPSDHRTGYFKLDTVAPTTGEATSYLKSSSTVWTNVDLASPNGPATLTATDATSGVASTQYKVKSGSNWGTTQSFAPITITDQNTHDIEFWATDNAGNVAVHQTKYYNLDKTAPAISGLTTPPATTNASYLDLSWTGSDNLVSPSLLTYSYRVTKDGSSYIAQTSLGNTASVRLGSSGSPLPEGSYIFYVKATDPATNTSSESSRAFIVDRTAPAISGLTTPAATTNASYLDLSWTGSDGVDAPGALTYSYRVTKDGSSYISQTSLGNTASVRLGSSGSPLPEGSYVFYVKATDTAGNTCSELSRSFIVDRTAPTISGLTTPAAWISANFVDLSWSGADNVDAAGALTYSYRVTKDGSSYISQTPLGNTASVRLGSSGSPLPEGSYVFYVKATDTAGNTCSELSRSFGIDRTAPSASEITSYLSTGSSTWNKVNLPGATLAGSDTLSGSDSVHYRVKTGAGAFGSWILYSGAITLSDEATHDIEFYATDNAGNDSTHVTKYYNLDKTAPTVAEMTSYLSASSATWNKVNLPGATLAGSDALSGLASVHYRVKTGAGAFGSWILYSGAITLSDEATHDIEFYATDNAGNDGAHVTKYYNLDKTAPTAAETTSYLTASSSTWKNVNLAAPNGPAVLAGADTGGSGVASVKYRIATGQSWGSWTTYSSGVSITSQGTHDVEFYATDGAGNDSVHVTKYYNLDKGLPTLTESTNYLTATQTWTNLDLAAPNGPALLSAADSISGVAGIWYRIRIAGVWGAWQTYVDGVTITDEAGHLVEAYALDNAGCESAHLTRYYNLDKTSPVLSFGTHAANYSAPSVTFTWSATDNLSSAGNLRYCYKLVAPGQSESSVPYGAETTDVTATYGSGGSPLLEGSYSFYCKVRDNAGNWDTKSFGFVVDRSTPTISGLTTPTAWSSVNYLDFTWSGSDGIDPPTALTYSYRVTKDGSSYVAQTSLGNVTSLRLGSSGSPLPEGNYVLYLKASDQAGNTCDELSRSFGIDRTAPSVSESTNYLTATQTWTNLDLAAPNGPALLSAADSISGVAGIWYRIRIAGVWGAWQTYVDGVTITDEAGHLVEAYALDNAGCESAHLTRYYNLDKTSPVLSFGTHAANYSAPSVTFTWSATDNLSSAGNLRYCYKLVAPGQSESSVPYGAETTDVTATYGSGGSPLLEGSYSFYCKVRDNAGNWDTKSFGFVVDRSTPTISGLTTPTAWSSVNYLDFTWSGSDGIDPPTALTYSYRVTKDGSSYVAQTSLGNVTSLRLGSSGSPLPEGNYVLYLKASDQAGNTCDELSRSFGIDRTAPSVSGVRPANGASFISGLSVTCDWTVHDSGSGVASETATVDGAAILKGARLDTYPVGSHAFVLVVQDVAGNTTASITRDFSVSTAPSTLAIWSPNGGSGYFQNSNDSIVWTAPTTYSSGHFSICVTSPTLGTFYVNTNVSATGASSYSLPWYVSQPPGTDWKAKVFYYDTGGVKVASDTSDATFAVVSRTPSMTSPNGGESYIQGSTQSITWTMPAPGALGVFRVCLTNPSFGSFYVGGDIPATGATTYSLPSVFDQAASNEWKVKIYYYDEADVKVASDTSDSSFTITGRTPHVTMPNGGAVLPQTSTQTISWTIPSPVMTGYFKVCMTSPTQGTTYLGGNIPATGALSYSLPWTVSEAVATDWMAKVYYYDANSVKIGSDTSDTTFAITIAPPHVTFPNGGGSYHRNSVQSVTWDMPSSITGGYFKVCATSPTKGTSYFGGNVPATGAASYTLPWTVTQAVGSDWVIKVFYYDASDVKLVSDVSDAPFSIVSP